MKIESLFAIIFILAMLGYIFRGRINEEIQLMRQAEAGRLLDEAITTFFEPLTKQEKMDSLTKFIDQLNAIQERLSKSIIAKRFIDYRESIARKQNHLQEIRQSQDHYSFSTCHLHSLIADSEFQKEQLIKLAEIIDETFYWDDTSATFSLCSENQCLALNMSLFENIELNQEECQEFINRVSNEIFENKPISLHITISEPEREEHYEAITL